MKIIEAKSLSGMAIEPFVEILVGNQKKHTTTKPHNNNPSWDEVITVLLHHFGRAIWNLTEGFDWKSFHRTTRPICYNSFHVFLQWYS